MQLSFIGDSQPFLLTVCGFWGIEFLDFILLTTAISRLGSTENLRGESFLWSKSVSWCQSHLPPQWHKICRSLQITPAWSVRNILTIMSIPVQISGLDSCRMTMPGSMKERITGNAAQRRCWLDFWHCMAWDRYPISTLPLGLEIARHLRLLVSMVRLPWCWS